MNIITVPLQLMALVFLLFAFSRVWLRAREGVIGPGMFVFWGLIWLMAMIAIIKPGLLQQFADELGVGRGVDAAIYISIVVLFYLNFRSNVSIESLRHEITRLTREIALKNK